MANTLKIGFIGLGNMGAPIAKNLIAAGFNITVYNRTPGKTLPFQALKIPIAATPQGAAVNADIVVTMVSDDEALKEVSKELIPTLKPGAIHLSMSTIAPATVKELKDIHQTYNVHYVAAPVMGRPPAAEAKLLSVLLSGNIDAKQKVKSIIEAIGQNSFDCGDNPETAHAIKLALNLMVFTNVELLSEVMLFGERNGVDKNTLATIINNTSLASPVLKIYGQLIASEQNNAGGFATRLANKDVRLLQETAKASGIRLPLADLVRTHFEESIALGNGEKDVTVIIQDLGRKLSL